MCAGGASGVGGVFGAPRVGVSSFMGRGEVGWGGSRLVGVSMARFDEGFWEFDVCVVGEGCHALHC